MSNKPEEDRLRGLCYRCEHRAQFLEDGTRPRFECGDIERAMYSCYMYRPVRPVVLEPNVGDERPVVGPTMISARSHSAGLMPGEIECFTDGNTYTLFWKPCEEKIYE